MPVENFLTQKCKSSLMNVLHFLWDNYGYPTTNRSGEHAVLIAIPEISRWKNGGKKFFKRL